MHVRVCSSDEEKSASSEKYSVVECVDLERTGVNTSAAACCPKTGSDTTHGQLTKRKTKKINYINLYFTKCLPCCLDGA